MSICKICCSEIAPGCSTCSVCGAEANPGSFDTASIYMNSSRGSGTSGYTRTYSNYADYKAAVSTHNELSTVSIVALVFMWLQVILTSGSTLMSYLEISSEAYSGVYLGIMLVYLGFCLFATISYHKKRRNGDEVGFLFKLAVLLFISLPAGIAMLFDEA